MLVDCSEVGEVVTAAESELIEDKLEEVGALKLEIAKLKEQIEYTPAKSYSRINEINEEITAKEGEIDRLRQEIEELGAETSVEKVFSELGISSGSSEVDSMNNGISMCSSFTPSDIVDTFDEAYDMTGMRKITYVDGKMQLQYHVIFQTKECKDPYLTLRGYDVLLLDEIDKGSEEAKKLLEATLEVCANILWDRLKEELEDYEYIYKAMTVAEYTPSSLFEVDAGFEKISSVGESLTCTVASASTIKFVYVYNEDADEWEYALTTSYAHCSITHTISVFIDGEPLNKSVDYNDVMVYGNYNDAIEDAGYAFSKGETMNTCLESLDVYYDGDKVFELGLFTPSSVSAMVY